MYYRFPLEDTQQNIQKTRLLRHSRYFSGDVLSGPGIRRGIGVGDKEEIEGGQRQSPAMGE